MKIDRVQPNLVIINLILLLLGLNENDFNSKNDIYEEKTTKSFEKHIMSYWNFQEPQFHNSSSDSDC